MSNLIRDTTFGSLVRWATKNRVFQFPEEKDGFELPASYHIHETKHIPSAEPTPLPTPLDEKVHSDDERTFDGPSMATPATIKDDPMLEAIMSRSLQQTVTLSEIVTRPEMSKTHTRADLENAYNIATIQESIKQQPSRPIAPTRTADGTILVDWYSTDDPENPQNWTSGRKTLAVMQIYLYTLAVYMSSSIITPSEPELIRIFGISQTVASLGLALYVLGYGIGPLVLSPISEIPFIGRNPPYIVTFGIYVILCIPTALVNNIPGLMVLRFLQGFFGSPCLATGGASLGDVSNLMHLPYFLFGWAIFALGGPSLAPLIAGFSVPAVNWHISLWEIVWIAGPTFLAMFFFLPETSTPNILLRRAQRIRALTGNPAYKSQSEISQANLSVSTVAYEALVIPWKINILDPAVLFTSIYTAIIYAIFYSFFEVFPLVYISLYSMNIGELGLVFLSVIIATVLAIPIYFSYIYYIVNPNLITHGLGAPEQRLIPALYASFFVPIGLFIFAWTSRPEIHWIVPTIGIVLVTAASVIIIQSIFIYVAFSYPQYSASLFAGNDFARSGLAFAAILWSTPMFGTLGVGKGVSVLGAFTIGCIFGIFALFFFGERMRARSKFAV